MRNTFIFSILLLMIASVYSCSKEISVPQKNAIINKWRIKNIIIDSVGFVVTPFKKDTLKRTNDSLEDLGTIEFIEGLQPNTGAWIENIIKDTFKAKNINVGYKVLTGTFKLESKKLLRFLSTSSDTLAISIKGNSDSLILTNFNPSDTARVRRITTINCVKF